VIRAIDFCVANKDKYWIDVINLSLGHPILEPPPQTRCARRGARGARRHRGDRLGRQSRPQPGDGVVGYGGLTSPGNAPSAITVGAIDTRQTTTRDDDVIPVFSSRGRRGSTA